VLEANANFYYFKSTGKWKYHGEGHLPASFFDGAINGARRREIVLEANGGKWPGIMSSQPDPGYHVVIILFSMEKAEDYGWPYMLPTVE
jgi:hypothetical protein